MTDILDRLHVRSDILTASHSSITPSAASRLPGCGKQISIIYLNPSLEPDPSLVPGQGHARLATHTNAHDCLRFHNACNSWHFYSIMPMGFLRDFVRENNRTPQVGLLLSGVSDRVDGGERL